MKILLGGIPLGCDNIGDEAILGCVVHLFRRLFPELQLTVCTAAPEETARLLQVRCVPLYGFDPKLPLLEFQQEVTRHDCYVWAGATGLSDYPGNAIKLLAAARSAGTPSIVWNVGMDSELNPAFFRVSGRKLALLRAFSRVTGGRWDAVRSYEEWLVRRQRRRLTDELRHCRAVITRDPESSWELAKSGYTDARIGADTAILQPTAPESALPSEIAEWSGQKIIAICMSAQRAITALAELAAMCDRLLERRENRIVFLPMNPVTDAALMDAFREKLHCKERSVVLRGCSDPAVVQLVASHCAVVVSSRLHLLILAANVQTPVVGIARGSKVDNFLHNFDLRPAGTVFSCDIAFLEREINRFLDGSNDYQDRNREAYGDLHGRLRRAEEYIQKQLESGRGGDGCVH